ncbi:MAG: acyl carrier protein [Gammaproteobacteria bacterium]|nr:acyl carrier protein [Gammaproteobacteria bacterium]
MQSKEEILEQLYELVRPYTKEPIELGEETGLINEVGLDSVKVMELMTAIEDHFDISVPLNILPNVQTIGDFAEQLQLLLKDS